MAKSDCDTKSSGGKESFVVATVQGTFPVRHDVQMGVLYIMNFVWYNIAHDIFMIET